MFCTLCGKELQEGAKFCDNCGTKVHALELVQEEPLKKENRKTRDKQNKNRTAASGSKKESGKQISKNILLGSDGVYRWAYEMGLLRNPRYFVLVWKIFFFIILGIFVLITIVDAIEWGSGRILDNLKIFAYFVIGMTVLVGISYLIYTAIMGGKLCMVFEMTDDRITCSQMPKQAKKAELIANLTVLAGLAGGNITTVGVGLNAARTSMTSEFARATKLKIRPQKHTVYIVQGLMHNQVYAEDEDFEFVSGFIHEKCTKATVK